MKPSRELIKTEHDFTAIEPAGESNGSSHGYNYGVDENADSEINLLDYWRAVRKRLWLVISIVALVSMLSVIYVARKPDIYQASARVQVDLENNAALVGKTPYVFGPTNDPVYFNTQLQILGSPGLMRRVVKALDLEHNPDFFKGNSTQKRSTWQTIKSMAGLGKNDKPDPNVQAKEALQLRTTVAASAQQDLVEAKRLAPYVGSILGGLKVDPVKETRGLYKETRLIDITFTHGDPEVAAKVVNAIAETYVYSNLEKKGETNTSTGEFLQKRIAELQQQIRTDEEKLVNYAKNNQIISLDANQNTVVERLAALNRQLVEAEKARIDAESAFNAAKGTGAAGALADVDAKHADDSEAKAGELRQKRALLMVDATEEAPEVKEIDTQIAELDRQVKDIRSRKSTTIVTNLETLYRQTMAREQALRKSFEQQRGETLSQNEAAINYRIIQQEITTNKTLLDSLLQRSKENDVIMASKPNNISIVDFAVAPDGPVGPNRTRTVFLAMFLSLGLGVGCALLLEYLDDTVHSTEEVERLLHLPALAVIPSALGTGKRRRLLSGPGGLQKRNGNPSENPELLMNVDGRSPLAESYRHLRTSVLLSTAGRAPRSLLVTSSLPGEGKTTTAVNTAVSLAQTGASVVIIDADMRRPRLRSIFGLSNGPGLSSILSSDVSEEELMKMVVRDPVSGLNVLPAGPIPPNPAELLGSDQMRRLMVILQSNFNHVVVDSPPITSFTDGVLISSMVDGVLLVVHGGKSSRHVVKRSRQLLLDIGAKIFGVVLNNVNLQSHDYYYYQRYYGSSYYKSDADDDEAETAAAGSPLNLR